MSTLAHVDLEPLPLERWRTVIDDSYESFERRMHELSRTLDGRTVWNVNSSAEGGGVAEMLGALLPYAVDAGWNVKWAVMSGDEEFFETTKAIHNALHGVSPPEEDTWDTAAPVYQRITDANTVELASLVRSGDVVLVHDPQPAGMIRPLTEAGAAVAWQCHIGTDDPNQHTRRAWDFLRGYVEPADRYVFTRHAYLWEGLDADRLRVIPPSIDAMSAKNVPLDGATVDAILAASGVTDGPDGHESFPRSDGTEGKIVRRVTRVDGDKPVPSEARIVLEVSRWDRLKDPVGFLRMFAEHLSNRTDAHLVFAGPYTDGVDDDPEGRSVLDACTELWRSFEPAVREHVHLLEVPMDDLEENAAIINALQHRADVVVQKSIEEGFGLTVSEAMWKARPVVASRVGGIQDQIEHGRSGLLVDDPYDLESFADAVASLLDDREAARRLGSHAQQRVRDHFLGPRQLLQYADLLTELIAEDTRATA